jgi:hypothetical protein
MTTRSTDSLSPPVFIQVQTGDAIPAEVSEAAARLGVAQYLPQVVDLTREIYGGFSRVSIYEDPEFEDETHILFHVPVNCSIEQALDKDLEWGRRLLQIIPRSPRVYMPSLEFRS